MARIAGVDIPKNKRGVIALTYIFGLGSSRAIEVLEKLKLAKIKVQDWNDDEIGAIREAVSVFKIEGELRSEFL
jgi:small subunit ribosomal protein S13